MKLLITGAGSYIGRNVADYIQNIEPDWMITQLDVQTDEWKKHDFSNYDTVFHVAGIAHRKITSDIEWLYYKVNRDLAIEVAEKSKECGVKHFVFMSSMSVYSDDTTYVNESTPAKPDNVYGKSKLQAEEKILLLATNHFVVSIIRPPMIYGKGCKGNYNSLRSLAIKFPFFPKVDNKRSMLFIDNFSEFMRQLIIHPKDGILYPQNAELVNTAEWVKSIAEIHGKKVYLSSCMGLLAKLGKHLPVVKNYCLKAFGDSYYDQKMSEYPDMQYQIVSFKESIIRTEN